MLISASKAVKINSLQQEGRKLQRPAVKNIAGKMTGVSTGAANFLKVISLIQLHRLIHRIERLEVACFITQISRGIQAGVQNFLPETLSTTFAQEIHFLQLARVRIATF